MEKNRSELLIEQMGKETLLGVAVGMESVLQMLDTFNFMDLSAEEQISKLRETLESGLGELKRDVPQVFVDDDA